MAIGNIKVLNINIFEREHSNGKPWLYLRDFGTLLMRITIYVVSAFLIVVLIWTGIRLSGNFLTPESRVDHKKSLVHFIKSVFMLIGTIVIMSIFIYGSEMILDIVNLDNKDELPIRVVVKNDEDIIYCFSTNITGYIRYMTQNNNVNLYIEKAGYTVAYILFVAINLFSGIFMLVRMLAMMALGILGPIIVGYYALGKEKKLPINFRNWVTLYGELASIQFVIAIIYKLMLEIAIS